MLPFDLTGLPLAALIGVFAAAAGLVWVAGSRLSGYAEAISERTGIGAAFIGALMLGGITSLPELATTLTAALANNATMAVNNLFGGVAMQVAILALADAALRRTPISAGAREPVVLLQGVLLIWVLGIAMAGMIIGEPAGWPVGPWTLGVLVTGITAFYLMRRYEGHAAWRPVTEEGVLEEEERRQGRRPTGDGSPEPEDGDDGDRRSLAGLVTLSALSALAILVAGLLLTRTGEALAEQTGLGSSFVGVALLAASTSLPELSTTLAAARHGRYDMAFSNVFGANLLDVALLAVSDLAYSGPPILNELDQFALFAALLAIVVTAVFLGGVIRRRVRTVGGIGIDSLAVAALYLGGLFALFTMR